MIAMPAVDLRGGKCVQLVGGRVEQEKVSLDNPTMVALRWFERGREPERRTGQVLDDSELPATD